MHSIKSPLIDSSYTVDCPLFSGQLEIYGKYLSPTLLHSFSFFFSKIENPYSLIYYFFPINVNTVYFEEQKRLSHYSSHFYNLMIDSGISTTCLLIDTFKKLIEQTVFRIYDHLNK